MGNKRNMWLGNTLLLLAALVWGCAFVAQSAGMQYVGPFTFNAVRMILGGITLLPVILIKDAVSKKKGTYIAPSKDGKKVQWIAGLICGVALAFASTLQQVGLVDAAPGKAGFLTALYIVLVPVCRRLFGNKISPTVWGGVGLALIGIYFLCITEGGDFFGTGEIMVLIASCFFTVHILSIDAFTDRVDGIRLSCMQFFVSGILCGIVALIFEETSLSGIWAANFEILYAGMGSCGIAYTFQILGQKRTNPTVASLLMSFESVFAVLCAIVVTADVPTLREGIGCILMFTAVILAQMEWKRKK